jgi:hypothetical protein
VEDPTTQELRVEQLQRELDEKQRAEDSTLESETETHDRRATKAEYLRAKLDERAEAERAAAAEDESSRQEGE